MPCPMVFDYQPFIDTTVLFQSKFPFSLLLWVKDLFFSLIGIVPTLPNVTLHVFILDISPFAFITDYSATIDPLMSFFRWLLTAILIVSFVRSYLDRIL